MPNVDDLRYELRCADAEARAAAMRAQAADLDAEAARLRVERANRRMTAALQTLQAPEVGRDVGRRAARDRAAAMRAEADRIESGDIAYDPAGEFAVTASPAETAHSLDASLSEPLAAEDFDRLGG